MEDERTKYYNTCFLSCVNRNSNEDSFQFFLTFLGSLTRHLSKIGNKRHEA